MIRHWTTIRLGGRPIDVSVQLAPKWLVEGWDSDTGERVSLDALERRRLMALARSEPPR